MPAAVLIAATAINVLCYKRKGLKVFLTSFFGFWVAFLLVYLPTSDTSAPVDLSVFLTIGLCLAIPTVPLCFLGRSSSTFRHLAVTLPVAAIVGYLSYGVLWGVACFTFGICDP